MSDRLRRDDLAREADTTVERIDRLVAIGALRPDADGTFGRADVLRSTLIEAFEAAGIGLDVIAQGIADRQMTLDHVERFYRVPGPRSDRTWSAFVAALGDRAAMLPAVLAAMGLVEPDPARRIELEEERLLDAFLGAWDLPGDDVPARAARIAGDAVTRLAEGWVGLFDETVSGPLDDAGLTVDELVPRVVEPGSRVAALVYPLTALLLARALERQMNALNIASIEANLVRRGLVPERPADPPAIVFADLAGYTRMTQEIGDDRAARVALRLTSHALDAARAHDGRVVKLLGDGVMLHFERPADALDAALDLVDAVDAAGLPPAHVGIAAGRVIARDGDYFGHTVNLAARIAGRAGPGEVLVSAGTVEALGSGGAGPAAVLEPVGSVALKGIAEPVVLSRARRA